jgi:hypothetical protein
VADGQDRKNPLVFWANDHVDFELQEARSMPYLVRTAGRALMNVPAGYTARIRDDLD